MADRFLDPMQTDTERIRDLWIKSDHLSRDVIELRVLVEQQIESMQRAIGIIEENDGDRVTLFLLRHILDGWESSFQRVSEDIANRALDPYKPF